MFAEATRKAAQARFKQKDVDAEGQEIQVNGVHAFKVNTATLPSKVIQLL